MPALFLGRRRADTPDLQRLGLQSVGDALDQSAFAGGVPPVDCDYDATARADVVHLEVEQLTLQLGQAALVCFVVDWAVEHLELIQDRPFAHRFPPSAMVPAVEQPGNRRPLQDQLIWWKWPSRSRQSDMLSVPGPRCWRLAALG